MELAAANGRAGKETAELNMVATMLGAVRIADAIMTAAIIAAAGSNRTDRPNNLWTVQ